MNRARVLLAAILAASGCVGGDDPLDVVLHVSFPTAVDGVVPYRAGGPLDVKVEATVAGLCTETRATVEIMTAESPAGATPSATATLRPVDGCALAGTVKLAWPPGGPVRVRAVLANAVSEEQVTIAVPQLGMAVGAPTRDALSLTYPLCLATNAVDGQIELKLTDATLVPTGDTATLALLDGDCGAAAAPAGPGVHHVAATARVTSSSFRVDATLVKSGVTISQAVPVGPQGTVALAVSADPPTLPAAGAIVAITVASTIGGAPAEGVPVKIETLPTNVTVMPASFVTGGGGLATVSLLVPSGATQIRVDAVASGGAVRDGITLMP